MLAPIMAAMIIISGSMGMVRKISIKPSISPENQLLKYPDSSPSGNPMAAATSRANADTYSEVRAPHTSSAKISSPRLSVPSQCAAPGAISTSVV